MNNVLTMTTPGASLGQQKMPGHWLLARLGKRVLRPGGMELTRRMIAALTIVSADDVVEFAPGLGITAQLALKRRPASYTAIERVGGGDSEQLPERVNPKVRDGKRRSDGPAW